MSSFSNSPLDRALARYAQLAGVRRRQSSRNNLPAPWQRFAAAAGASLAMSTTADAAVQPFAPQDPIRVELMPDQFQGDGNAEIDLDFDGNFDFNIDIEADLYQFTTLATTFTARRMVVINGLDTQDRNKVAGEDFFAHNLLSGNTVPGTHQFVDFGILRSESASTAGGGLISSAGEWDTSSSGYLGVRFQIPNGGGNNEHFGWIRVATESNENGLLSLNILEWAYEDVPGMMITVGDRVGSPPAVPGDYDGNGTVEPNDLTLWKNTFGSEVVPGTAADGDGNGLVDAADYTIYQDNVGNMTSVGSGLSASSNIPEPSTCTLGVLALGAAGVAALRRRDR